MTPASALQFVFGTCAAGAVVLTVNVVLLGGNIGFFQSMCLLGYCLFPMDVAAIVTACTTNMIARWIVVLVSCAPSSEDLGSSAKSVHHDLQQKEVRTPESPLRIPSL